MKAIPHGTVVFVFTDIEGSTRLWESSPDKMSICLAEHDQIVGESISNSRGHIFKTMGDAFLAAFSSPLDAIEAAINLQTQLHGYPWPDECTIRVRTALHVGAVEIRNEDYFGPPLNRVARLLSAARGGQIVLSSAMYELVRDILPANASIIELGLHRLKDLVRPEQVYQLKVEGIPHEFPSLNSLDNPALPNNLPQQTTSFIGREAEVIRLKQLAGESRCVTLVGSGGAGKSRLTLQVGAELLGDDPDGVWLVELAPISDRSLVPSAVMTALGISDVPGRSAMDAVVDYLRSRRLLLLLDNCEHVLDVAAKVIDQILRHCPNVRVIANSREALNIPGEATFRVPSLSFPKRDQIYTPQSLGQFDSVRLFLSRAQFALATFSITNENAPAVADICYRLDGIPLAIELAAARVKSMSVESIHERLNDRFRLLTGGSRTAMPRHQTLRALFDWSFDLLENAERNLFRRLGVFAGGWTLESAEKICADERLATWDVLDALASLVDKSLVQVDTDVHPARYRLLESAKQYSLERQEAEESYQLRFRHAEHFAELIEKIGLQLEGADSLILLQRIESERENIRSAFEFAMSVDIHEGAAIALKIASSMRMFFWMRGPVSEGESWMRRALESPHNASPSADRAGALFGRAVMRNIMDDQSESLSWLTEAFRIRNELRDESGAAAILNMLGIYHKDNSDFQVSLEFFEQSLAIRRRLNLQSGIASSLTNIGSTLNQMGDLRGSLDVQLEACQIKRTLGELPNVAISLQNIASLELALDEFGRCRESLVEGIKIASQILDRRVLLNLLDTASEYLARNDRFEHAVQLRAGVDRFRSEFGIARRSSEDTNVSNAIIISPEMRMAMDGMSFIELATFSLQALNEC